MTDQKGLRGTQYTQERRTGSKVSDISLAQVKPDPGHERPTTEAVCP